MIDQAEQFGQSKISWTELEPILHRMGIESIDANSFQSIYDETPAIQGLIHDFDEEGITLSTSDNSEPNSGLDAGSGTDTVHSTAMRSTRKHQGR